MLRLIVASGSTFVFGHLFANPANADAPPNIVYILCDDLGYGDVHCLNPERGKISTPAIDHLAAQGMTFTDAHAASSVCTPSRYGILTGRYCWRTRLQAGVLSGYDRPLIPSDRLTVASLLHSAGYSTACMGKWHLGLEWARDGDVADNYPSVGTRVDRAAQLLLDHVDYAKPVGGGPMHLGFDSFFGIAGSMDMPPFVWIENDHVLSAPTRIKKFGRVGLAADDFEAVDAVPGLIQHAIAYIHSRQNVSKPFFLYLALTSPHTPIVPAPEWVGKSRLTAYGDFVMQTDSAVGQVLQSLDEIGAGQNTLVIFTSDNGCSPFAGVTQMEAMGHFPSAQFRGYKSDIWDGGHRIPFIVRWPGKIKAGSQSDLLICLTDFLATCADLLQKPLPPNAGEDSVSILPALLEKDSTLLREAVVHHSIEGRFAIRQGNWKLELCPGSGGWSNPLDKPATLQGLPPIQLYDLSHDISEKTNDQASQKPVVDHLIKLLTEYVNQGRSTPGPKQSNDVKVDIWKDTEAAKKYQLIGD